MLIDMPLDELQKYSSAQACPEDFDEFWASTIGASRAKAQAPVVTRIDTDLTTIDVFDVTFSGFDGQPIKAWYRRPASVSGDLPVVVQYAGYGGGRLRPMEDLLLASAGYAHFAMDTRGQGSSWGIGHTPDDAGSGPHHPGFMTRGIDSPDTYYYRRLITDAVLAVDAAKQLPGVVADQVAVQGGSQGGGLSLAVAGLRGDLQALVTNVPFLCDFPRATRITDSHPYREIANYLQIHRDRVDAVHQTLSYFDGVNFAQRATVPSWWSVGLMDVTCPPSTIFGAYNVYSGPKHMAIWDYNGHEGGGVFDAERTLAALRQVWG